MYPQELLNNNSNGFFASASSLPAYSKPFPAMPSFPDNVTQQEAFEDDDEEDQQSSDDDEQQTQRSRSAKPSTPVFSNSFSPAASSSEPAMTPSCHKTSAGAAARPNMSASHSITLEMLRPHFETPLAQVAKRFGICVTLLKKICRKHNISRWPHRQITGLRKSIASMEHAIGYFEGSRRDSYAEQLRKQKTKLALLLEDPTKCSPLPLASRHIVQQQQQRQQQQQQQFQQYELSSVFSSPSSSTASSPQQQQASRSAFPLFTPQQQTQSPADPFSYRRPVSPEPFYPTQGFLTGHLPRPMSTPGFQQPPQQQQPTFYLPPLRTEPRRMLPPIASLVGHAATW